MYILEGRVNITERCAMCVCEQYSALKAEVEIMERQQEKVARLQSHLAESLRQRAIELAELQPETIIVGGSGCFDEQLRTAGAQWFDEVDRCARRIVIDDEGDIYSSESHGNYKRFSAFPSSELRYIPVKDIRRRFKPLFDE